MVIVVGIIDVVTVLEYCILNFCSGKDLKAKLCVPLKLQTSFCCYNQTKEAFLKECKQMMWS